MSFSALNQDLLDQILRRLSDFTTLAASIRTNKALYAVFQAHPKSIIRKVAENACGHPDVLPAALRLVRKVLNDPDDDEDQDEDEDEDENEDRDDHIVIPQEPSEQEIFTTPLTREEGQLLNDHGQVVHSLEDIYSWSYKDRTSPTSKLTPAESVRFKRGMYRFWLFCQCYQPPEYDNAEGNREAARQCAADTYLELVDDLFEVAAAATFCAEMCKWNYKTFNPSVHLPPTESFFRDVSCLGPKLILEDFQNLLATRPEGADGSGFFWNSFDRAVARLHLSDAVRHDRLVNAILQEVIGANDNCDRCHTVVGVGLWGATNWPLLGGYISPADLAALLPGLLPRNTSETQPLLLAFGTGAWATLMLMQRAQVGVVYTKAMEAMIDMAAAGQDGTWTKDGWYCLDCLRALCREQLWRWWHAKKLQDGSPVLEDCWYGYNCRTMTHRTAHATKLNHLCLPTRGE